MNHTGKDGDKGINKIISTTTMEVGTKHKLNSRRACFMTENFQQIIGKEHLPCVGDHWIVLTDFLWLCKSTDSLSDIWTSCEWPFAWFLKDDEISRDRSESEMLPITKHKKKQILQANKAICFNQWNQESSPIGTIIFPLNMIVKGLAQPFKLR